MTNDSTKLFKRNNNRYKERALSLKNYKKKGSQIKQMIEEDKKKYGDKKFNKDFIFVSQSPKKDLNNNDNSSFRKNYTGIFPPDTKNALCIGPAKILIIFLIFKSLISIGSFWSTLFSLKPNLSHAESPQT